MTLTLIPDGEKVVADYLREHPDLDVRVVSKTPEDTAQPWIRITQLDGPSKLHPEHLVPFWLQYDCYAGATGGKPEASLIARQARAALAVINKANHAGAVVTGAEITGDARIPDTEFEPARERRVLTATVYAHS